MVIVGKKMFPIYIDESIYDELHRYAYDSRKSVQLVLRPFTEEFLSSVKHLVEEIKLLKSEEKANV